MIRTATCSVISTPYVSGPRYSDAKVYFLVDTHTCYVTEGFAFGSMVLSAQRWWDRRRAARVRGAHGVDLGKGLIATVPNKSLLALDGSPGWAEPGEELDTAMTVIIADGVRDP